MITMTQPTLLLALFASLIFPCSLMAATSAMQDIDSLTQQWLNTERSTVQLESDWQLEQALLSQRIHLLTQQNQQLQKLIDSAHHTADELTQQRQQLLLEQTQLEQDVAQYEQSEPKIIYLLQQQLAAAPPYLQQQLMAQLAQLTEKKQLNHKYQLITDVLKQLSKNRELIQVKKGLIQLSQGPLMAEQLYLGNSQAWFITADKSTSGIGFATQAGWQWLPQEGYEDEISTAIQRAKNLTPDQLILLPVQLEVGP